MKELKIFAVVALITGVLYWGVEPYAHEVMHPGLHDKKADFSFDDTNNVDMSLKGDATRGQEVATTNCIGCHGIKSQGFEAPMSNADSSTSYGVVPPDLSSAGYLYDAKFLANFIKNPAKAGDVDHKFSDEKPHPMGNFDWLGDQAILDAVAYFKSIAPKEMSNKEAYEDACSRCHAMRYDGLKALTDPVSMKNYIGSVPPDLSQMIRSRGEHYLNIFINNPQAILHGTAMPKVGLTEEVQEQVVTYLESVGDRKKAEREALAPWVLGYLVIFTIFAYLWKREKWSEVH